MLVQVSSFCISVNFELSTTFILLYILSKWIHIIIQSVQMDAILFCSPQEQTSWIWPSTRMYGLYHYNKPSFFTFCSTKLWLARWPPGFQNVFDFVDIIVLSHSDHSIDSTTGPRRGWMWYTTTQMETLVSTMASRVPKCL
jgi:hypothetical protein